MLSICRQNNHMQHDSFTVLKVKPLCNPVNIRVTYWFCDNILTLLFFRSFNSMQRWVKSSEADFDEFCPVRIPFSCLCMVISYVSHWLCSGSASHYIQISTTYCQVIKDSTTEYYFNQENLFHSSVFSCNKVYQNICLEFGLHITEILILH